MPSVKAKLNYAERHRNAGLCIKCPNIRSINSISLCEEHLKRSRERMRTNVQRLPENSLLSNAKERAKRRGTICNISADDIKIPEFCPILGIKLERGVGGLQPNSPTLDEIIPGNGYTVDNIQVISHKANTMKSNATKDELLLFSRWITETYA